MLLLIFGVVELSPAQAQTRSVGIWYQSWYTNTDTLRWKIGHGTGSKRQMLGDVTGDGNADAVVFFDSGTSGPCGTGFQGAWYLAPSTGSGFGSGSCWRTGHGSGSANQFVTDVTGDGKADAVVYFDSGSSGPCGTGFQGAWYVARSTGSSFASPTCWKAGHGSGSQNQLVGDVSGDGKADAVAYFDTGSAGACGTGFQGTWYVAKSTGSSFGGASCWKAGHGSGSQNQLLGDVTGDGKQDAVAYFDTGQAGGCGVGFQGAWYVAPSTGGSFGSSKCWKSGHGHGSSRPMLGDIDGDLDADAVVYFETIGSSFGVWHAAKANPSLAQFGSGTQWKSDLGANFKTTTRTDPTKAQGPSFWQGLGDVIGGDAGAVDPLAFYAYEGSWAVMPATGNGDAVQLNMWDAWDIRYRPITLGQPNQYDSGDTAVIDEHLSRIWDAGIDFLLFDHTNGFPQWITDRTKAVCQRIAVFNLTLGRNLRYAMAIGPSNTVGQANIVQDSFVNDPVCGLAYFQYKSKPLLVAYENRNFGDSRFTVRYAQGQVPRAGTNPTSTSCGTPSSSSTPPPSEYGLYLGWAYPFGTVKDSNDSPNPESMVVMPGWNNYRGAPFVSRKLNGVDGDRYKSCYWNKSTGVLPNQPDLTVITSYNDYAEETAVAPTNTTNVVTPTQAWPSNSLYWTITQQCISSYRLGATSC